MPAFGSINPPAVPLSRPSTSIGVFRYRPDALQPYSYLPNIKVVAIQYREGADPGVARFRYAFDQANPSTEPTRFEQVLGTDSDLPGVVQNDDRLVVFSYNPDGSVQALFDGFAQVPALDLSSREELATFLAYGVAVREWDTPIDGALIRNADAPFTPSDVKTDVETHFNPSGQPNASPQNADSKDAFGNSFAVFLDPLLVRNPDVRRFWSLSMAARYLCFHHNPAQKYVLNPDGASLDALLDSLAPVSNATFQPNDPSTYTSRPIIVPDFPATGKVWPEALEALLRPNGFGMAFRLGTDVNGNPFTYLDVFRRDDGSPSASKDLYLQAYGASLDPAATNLGGAHLERDIRDLANAVTVDSSLVRYEASFVLAPGFVVDPADARDSAALAAFDMNNPGFLASGSDKYRLYVFDETGDGHWDFGKQAQSFSATSLDSLFNQGRSGPSRPALKRRRIPIGELLTLDPADKPLKARLSISTNYTGAQPGLWNGTGTWQPINGGFELLEDRLGIWIGVPNPNRWQIGESRVVGAPYPAGIVHGVEDQANSSGAHFALRLTCVIEADQTLTAKAARRPVSPSTYTIERRVDARDRYSKQIKAATSEFNLSSAPIVVRDDTDDAQADADARRLAAETGKVLGAVTIPRFTTVYTIGDKIRSIQGRDLSLQTNAGAPSIEAPVFPCVVGLTWDFANGQSTILHLSDHKGGRS